MWANRVPTVPVEYRTARLQYFADGSGRVSASGNLLSGVLAGGVEAVLWTAPTERLKVLQQKKVRITKPATQCAPDGRQRGAAESAATYNMAPGRTEPRAVVDWVSSVTLQTAQTDRCVATHRTDTTADWTH